MLDPRSSAISGRRADAPTGTLSDPAVVLQPIAARVGITLGRGFLLARPAVAPGDVSPHVRRWLRARAGQLAARTAVTCGPRVATAS
jgi:hypothetical protein